jgi:ATP-dependent Lon protease
VHLHVPEGATPKDGPSAGVTMATALLSLARGDRLRRPLAMTGELTLTGQVLPVGGIREKVIAARRAKIDEVILPFANRGDYEALPEYLKAGLEAHFVRTYREVFDVVFDTSQERRQLH